MNKGTRTKTVVGILGAATLAILPTISFVAEGADHVDSPAAVSDPPADLTDLYAWMDSTGSKLNLVMNVFPFAGANAEFSTAVNYVFHVNSSASYGAAQTEAQILCSFYKTDHIECWGPANEYVVGKADDPAGITSASGKMRVFAGLRSDPFFFNLEGFQETVKAVVGAANTLTFDAQGCPAVSPTLSNTLVTQLKSTKAGAAAVDNFANANVLSLVVQLDDSLVNTGGPVLGVWASTHRAQ